LIESGWALAIALLIGVPFLLWVLYMTIREAPIDIAARQAREAIPPARIEAVSAPRTGLPDGPPLATPSQEPIVGPSPGQSNINPAVAWNVMVIVVGAVIALIGLINGLASHPENSALRQTVAALWVTQGLLGLLIAAVGILGATIASALNKARQPI
jgi:hypothetical protein